MHQNDQTDQTPDKTRNLLVVELIFAGGLQVYASLTRPAPIGTGRPDQTQLAALTRLASEEDERTRPNWLSLSLGSFLHTALAWSLLAAYMLFFIIFSLIKHQKYFTSIQFSESRWKISG